MDTETVWATAIAGLAANVIFHPLDTVRVIHQTANVHSPSQYWLRPVSRYWQGLVPAVAFSVPAFVVDVCAYRETKRLLGGDSITSYLIAGAASQVASSVLWTPMEIVCGRLQLRNPKATRSLVREMRDIYHIEGIRGFFRGYWLGIGIYLPYTMAWWTAYDSLKTYCGVGLASTIATVIGETMSNIFGVVRTRLQLATSPDLRGLRASDSQGVRAVLTNLVAEAGVGRALVRGLHIRLLTAIPTSAFSMIVLEHLDPDEINTKTDAWLQTITYEH